MDIYLTSSVGTLKFSSLEEIYFYWKKVFRKCENL